MPVSKLKAAAVAVLLSTSAMTAYAATDAAPNYQTQETMLKTADQALTAITRAHAARLALFENDLEAAQGRLAEARAEFLAAEKELNDLTIGDTEDPTNAARYLPFDMSMSLTETFTETTENKQAVEKAAGMMKTGATDDAVKLLRMANIEVNVSTAMLPIVETSEQFEKAQTFLDDGKYYEANLALKNIEDSVIVRTFTIDEIPQQGAAE